MLHTLELFDFAIADRVAVQLGPGLNVLTGETGAGKSLLVDALALLAGGRADDGVVRAGRDAALVQATWGGDRPLTAARRIVRDGRNVARVDGEIVTVAELQATLATRLGIFGQQAYRTLLDAAEQRGLLDRHLDAGAAAAAAEAVAAWDERQQVRTRLTALREAARDRARQLDLLRYQVDEIDAARLAPEEDARLDARLTVLRHVERVREGVAGALEALSAADESGDRPTAADRLTDAVRALAQAARHDPQLERLADEAGDALSAVQAIGDELERALTRLASEPGELDRLEARRAEIEGLERKYGSGVAGVLAMRDALAAELDGLTGAEAEDAALADREARTTARLASAAAALGEGRARAAARLAPAVTAVLRELALPHARFEIALEPLPEAGRHGAERVVFRFGANLGEPLAPLHEVASGGELSRAMLALHAAAGSTVATLVFDEVDTGLGGRSGRAVGEVLARLARGRQVLVVTHLAQVAAFADHHLRVDKAEVAGRTVTRVASLAGEDRVEELARMLAGDAGDVARRHARALLRDPTAA
ncbi:MAG: DNA repair protein RecN [Trueperaceae bacterium]|nr:DNA repair protein RecN [Trueperaceae bacterium]